MSLRGLLSSVVVALVAFASTAQAALPPTLSGSWFDPVHAGHGFSIEMLEGDRAIAYWFVYDEHGAPVHLYLDGRVDGRTIEGPAYLARGMRFGAFDPATRSLGHWGELSITFDSCTAARLRYDANGPAGGPRFGRGDIALARLASIGELECEPNTFPAVATGIYRGLQRHSSGLVSPMRGLVDRAGRLWASSETINDGAGSTGGYAPVVVGATPRFSGDATVARAVAYESSVPYESLPATFERVLTVAFEGERVAGTSDVSLLAPRLDFALQRDAAASASVDHAWTLQAFFQRTFAFDVHGRLPQRWVIRLGGYSFCLGPAGSTTCLWLGNLVVPEPGRSVFTFTLRGPAEPGGPNAQLQPIRYRGTGWIEWRGDDPAELVLVADGPLGIVARLEQ